MAQKEAIECHQPLLEDSDVAATSNDRNDPGRSYKSRPGPWRQQWIFHWLLRFCLLTFVWTALFSAIYTFDMLDRIRAPIDRALAKVHNIVQDTYYGFAHPHADREIADLMTEFYELLAEMGYFEPELINRPPHVNPSINTTLARELRFSTSAVRMMQLLPYLGIENDADYPFHWLVEDGNEFILHGRFSDMRIDEELLESRDPFYAWGGSGDDEGGDWDEPDGKYMKPDYVCLNLLGNHGVVMVLNVRNCMPLSPFPFQYEFY
jgi:hypothetical protein